MTYSENRRLTTGNSSASHSTALHDYNEQYDNRTHSLFPMNSLYHSAHPSSVQSPAADSVELSRVRRFDAYLLAIVRIEDKRNTFYSAEVVGKLRQKEQKQSFINKPCSLYITNRSLVIFDRITQVVAETVPLENVDPTCVHADAPDTLNDIFMYRLIDRSLTTMPIHSSGTYGNDSSSVVVFKCTNNEARMLVDKIRTGVGKPLKSQRSTYMGSPNAFDKHFGDINYGGDAAFFKSTATETSHMTGSISEFLEQTGISTKVSTTNAPNYYKHLIEELNKCFDDIELFVRYLEALMEYTKELERDQRRKDKRLSHGLKQMIEKLPDDRYFIDVLQKFKHSFNLLGELKHIIHNPNAPELVHYLLSPLQFILFTLRTKHAQQLKIAQDIWMPAITNETRELLLNCLTSKEQEIIHSLGSAWIRTNDAPSHMFSEYRPVFYNGNAVWIQNASIELSTAYNATRAKISHPFTKFDERSQTTAAPIRPASRNDENDGSPVISNILSSDRPSPVIEHLNLPMAQRSTKNGILNDHNTQMQNEHAWAIDRKRAGAKVCAVKIDRKGKNPKELTVRRGELIEIEDCSKKWWRARNFHGTVGHVPNNIVEEIEIESRPVKVSPSVPSGINMHYPGTTTNNAWTENL